MARRRLLNQRSLVWGQCACCAVALQLCLRVGCTDGVGSVCFVGSDAIRSYFAYTLVKVLVMLLLPALMVFSLVAFISKKLPFYLDVMSLSPVSGAVFVFMVFPFLLPQVEPFLVALLPLEKKGIRIVIALAVVVSIALVVAALAV